MLQFPMRIVDLIAKKRDGGEHTADEISSLIASYTDGSVPDYQMSAWLMAVVWRGLSDGETFALTDAMVDSGDLLDLSGIPGFPIDKHSTGGVGDKTTLAVVPILASAGVPVAKMSGRGLGHTGGTLDKIESVPGVRTILSTDEILDQVRRIGACICAQTDRLVPADRKIYALRDATATVESLPLIAASVMSKKIAAGGRAIVLDVKVGDGAFMKSLAEARRLAELMIRIGEARGRKVTAVLSNMDIPLGRAIGNLIEMREVANMLKYSSTACDPRLFDLVVRLAADAFVASGVLETISLGEVLARRQIESGAAFHKFREILKAQGGDPACLEQAHSAPVQVDVLARRDGYVAALAAKELGLAAMRLGAGREKKEDQIDPCAGIALAVAFGGKVAAGDLLATLYTNDAARARGVEHLVSEAIHIGESPPDQQPLILETIGSTPVLRSV